MGPRDETRLLVATAGHAEGIAALHGRLFEKAWDTEGVERLLAHPACLGFVTLDPDDPRIVLGFVIAQIAAGEGEILSLGVGPKWQRRGVATRLVAAIVETARRRETKRLFLDVAAGNGAAIALYRRLAFSEMGRRKEYYAHLDGTREDALLMVRDL